MVQCMVIVLILTGAYWMIQAILRHVGPIALWAIFGLVPLASASYWVRINDFDLFIWIKIISMMICNCWGTFVRFSNHGSARWYRRSIVLMLAANIAEATFADCLAATWPSYVNALSGIGLMISLCLMRNKVEIDNKQHQRDLHCDLPLVWIIGYTLWNWTFVYLNYPDFAGQHLAVLGAALIVGIANPRLWVQARAVTLGSSLIVMAFAKNATLGLLETYTWSTPDIGQLVASLTLSWVAFALVQALSQSQSPLVRNVGYRPANGNC